MNEKEATERITNYYFWVNKPTREQVKECIDAHADLSKLVGVSDIDTPYTIMTMAAQYCPDSLEDLKKGGADINQRDPNGEAAIHIAARYSVVTPETLQKLIDLGADVHLKCSFGNALGARMYEGLYSDKAYKKLEILFKAGMDPNDTGSSSTLPPLFSLAHEIVREYEEAEINSRYLVTTVRDKDLLTFKKYARKLELMIKYGADIHKKVENDDGKKESFYSVTSPVIPFISEMDEFLSTHKKEEISQFIEERLESDEKYWHKRTSSLSTTLKKKYAEQRKTCADKIKKILKSSTKENWHEKLDEAMDVAADQHLVRVGECGGILEPYPDPADPEFYKKDLIHTALKFKVKGQKSK